MSKIKNLFREWFKPHDSFVVRNPLFPVEKFFNWKSNCKDLASVKTDLIKSLKEFYQDPLAQEALYIGSADLHEQLRLWLDDQTVSKQKQWEKNDKIERT